MTINEKMIGILFGENYYYHGMARTAIGRTTGIHRVATQMRKRNAYVEVVDFFNSWSDDELVQYLNKLPRIDFIGFGLNPSPLIMEKVNLVVSKTKEINPSVKILVGGSDLSDSTIEGADLYFKGFAEGAMDDIMQFVRTGKFNPFIIDTTITPAGATRKIIDCMKHYPSYDLNMLSNEYIDTDFIQRNETLPLEIGRGCIFKCKFCTFLLTGKNKNDYIREKESVKQELISNYTKWGVTRYQVTDDTYNDNQIKVDLLAEIAEEIDFKLDLVMYARADLLRAFPGSAEKLIKAGVKGVYFGIESLNEQSSKAIGKGISGDRLKEYLVTLKKNNPQLHITCSFITGLPYESIETFNENLEWALASGVVDSWVFNPLGIVIANDATGVAPFTYEYKDYGYVEMTQEEYDEKVKANTVENPAPMDINDLPSILRRHRIDKIVTSEGKPIQTSYRLIWKNEHMDFLDSVLLSERWQARVRPYATAAGFNIFAQSFNKDELDLVNAPKMPHINWGKQIADTLEFINNYKRNKLAYDFNSIEK